MSQTYRVSVIIPARNADKFIAETFDSLLAQTDPSWQAIVINDRSTDKTQTIIDAYAARDPRFVSFEGPGVGVSSARNLGLDKATGERIMFLDSDDWVEPNWLELMNAALDAKPGAVVAYCGYIRAMSDGQMHKLYLDPQLQFDAFRVLARGCEVGIHCVLIDRQELDAVGRFDTQLKTSEDWDLWLRLSRRGKPWVLVDRHLSYYRTGHQSLTQDIDTLMVTSETVFKRAFSADPRVPSPARANARGARQRFPGELRELIAGNSLWCLSSSIARGRAPETARSLVRPYTNLSMSTGVMSHVIIESFMQGAGLTAESLVAQWDTLQPRVEAILSIINAQWRDDAKIAALRTDIDSKIIGLYSSKTPAKFKNTVLVTVDLREPVDLPTIEGADRVTAKLVSGETDIGEVTAGLLQPIAASDWERLALLSVDRRDMVERLPDLVGRVDELHSKRLVPRKEGGDARLGLERSTVCKVGDAFLDRTEDPSAYASPYETEKFERTLAMLDGIPAGNVLELGCADGRFSRLLAPRVDRLVATDVSEAAVRRAQSRSAETINVEFRTLDIVADPIPSGLDVIFCCEVLYFLSDKAALEEVARKLAEALPEGGRLIMAHAVMLQDNRAKTGFDWGAPHGAETFARVFAEAAGLDLEKSDQTELYRIDRFVKTPKGDQPAPAQLRTSKLANLPIGPAARDIYWGGTAFCKSDFLGEPRDYVPVLMYHAIADEGPKALDRYRTTPAKFREQMRWLKQNGFYSVTSEEVAVHLATREPFRGRPIVITFDDGMQNFADEAWPILKEFGFVPEMFLVTDLLGMTSSWDAAFGSNYPLMAPETIKTLRDEGVVFGSHMATHPKSDKLSTEEIRDELVRSRDAMAALLGAPPFSVAAPYGLIDSRYADVAWRAGYAVAYSCEHRLASIDDPPLLLPRLEVHGQMTIEQFKSMLLPSTLPQFKPIESGDLISIVVASHNKATTLDWTLQGLRRQTHRNLEIIVVDCGSSDDTPSVVRQHAAQDPRISLITLSSGSLAEGRQAGWKASTGRAIAFVGPGAFADNEKFGKLYSALLSSPEDVSLAYSWWHNVNEWGQTVGSGPHDYIAEDALPALMRRNYIGDGTATLIRRSALEKIGGPLADLPSGAEDEALRWMQLRLAEVGSFALYAEYLSYCVVAPTPASPEHAMQAALAVADAMIERHPELKTSARVSLRRTSLDAVKAALRRRKPAAAARVMLLMFRRDPEGAIRLPVRTGKFLAKALKARVSRFGLVPTLEFYLQRFVTRR